jgi:hypothetical protein
MRSIESTAGEFLMDNRVNSGVPDEIVVAQGLPVGAGRGLFEEKCYTCSHCETVVVMNRSRTRPRGFCKKCNHVLCDACDVKYTSSGHQCIPVKAFAEEVVNAAINGAADPVAVAEFYFLSKVTR